MRLSFIILLLFTINSHAEPSNWALSRNDGGVQIHQKPTASGFAVTRGVVKINASLDALLTLMHQRSNCAQWVYSCIKGTLTKQISPKERIDYTVINSPLWFADRDMYVHSFSQFNDKSKTFVIKLTGVENHDQGQVGRVRIRNLWGTWTLQQTGKQTLVTYQIHANPQLPASAVLDLYMVESVFQTLQGLQRTVQKPIYQNATLPELHHLWKSQ